ncbi:MAG: hypothetical protein LJE90_07675 [Betaproteobacteria bacterium]|nr:hypothetical protein [Betaproteobacteria bacterium]
MLRSLTACCMILLALAMTAAPQARAADVALRGASNCAIWTKGRAQGAAEYEKAWLAGYFSGLAIGTDVNFWGIKGRNEIDNESVWKWMDEYCAAHPKANLVTAAEKLFLERFRVVSD